MRFAALISGGKDSIFNICECISHGHELLALINLSPPYDANQNPQEIDSFMYQSVGNEGVKLIAEVMKIPLYQTSIKRDAKLKNLLYEKCLDDEVEDLFDLILKVVNDYPQLEAISSGAILSDYQRIRVENVTARLGLRSLAYLWHRSQHELLGDMINVSIDAILIKIASFGLEIERDLGTHIIHMASRLYQLSDSPYFLNACGEGGEYETFTLDCPLFHERIKLNSSNVVLHSKDPFSPVAYLQLTNLSKEPKPADQICTTSDQLMALGSTCTRRPLIDPLTRLLTLWDDFMKDIDDCKKARSCDVEPFDRVIIERHSNLVSFLDSRLFVTPNCLGCADQDEICQVTRVAFRKLKKILVSENVQMENILQIFVMFNRDLTEDVMSTFHSVYLDEYKNWQVEHCKQTEFCAIFMPTLVWIGQKNPNHLLPPEIHNPLILSLSAFVTHSSNQSIDPPRGLHCLSISHWIPPAIGPHSQALQIVLNVGEDVTAYCGQLGLIPELEIMPFEFDKFMKQKSFDDAIECESYLALRHIFRILKTMSNQKWNYLKFGVCYSTTIQSLQIARRHFHSLICVQIFGIADASCPICESKVVWTCVSSLPKNAHIEWHWFGGSWPAVYSLKCFTKSTVCDYNRVSMILYKTGTKLDILLDFNGILVPVERFLSDQCQYVVLFEGNDE